jgi:hypothetical protein
MRPTAILTRIQHLAARAVRASGRLSRRLAEGIPTGFVAALAVLVLVAILYTIATREPKEPRGSGEFTMFPDSCLVDTSRQVNLERCEVLGPGVYRVHFTKSLVGSTPFVSRGSCCLGRIAASVTADRAVTVVIGSRPKGPIRASVLVP